MLLKVQIGSEGGKEALTVAAEITCVVCLPAAGPGLCIACGILIAKVIG